MNKCKSWVVILLLIVFFPVGLYLMWAKTNWKKNTKIIVTGVIAVLFIVGLISGGSNGDSIEEQQTTTQPTIATTMEPTTEAPTTEVPTTAEPTTEEPTTVVPTTAEPTTEKITEEPTEPATEKTFSSSSSSKKSNNNFQTYDNEEQQNISGYVLNTNTMKVHRPDCRDVKRISPENYATISSLEEAYAQGYSACGHCHP